MANKNANHGEFVLRINMLNEAFCNRSGMRDADCEAFELANVLRWVANAIEGERSLMEDDIIDSDGKVCGSWSRV